MVLEIFITSPPKDSVGQQGSAIGGVDSHRGMYSIPEIELFRAKNVRANAGGLMTVGTNAIKVHKIKGSLLQRSNNKGYKAVGDEISKNINVHIDDKTFRREQFFARKTKYRVFKSRESAADDQLRQNSAILQSHINDSLRVASKRRMIDVSKRQSLERTRKQLLQYSGQTTKKAAVCLGRSDQKTLLSSPPSATQCVNWAIERVELQTVAELEADVLLDDIESERAHRKHPHGRDGSKAVEDDLDIDVVKRLDAKLLQMNKKYQQQAQTASTMIASSAFRTSFMKSTAPAHHGIAVHHAPGPFAYHSNVSRGTTPGVMVVDNNKKKARLVVNEELRTLKTRKTLFEKTLRLTANEFHGTDSGGVPDNNQQRSAVSASDSGSSIATPLRGSYNRASPFKPSRPRGELSSGSRELSRLGSISTDQTDQLSTSSRTTTSSVSAAHARRSSHLTHRSLYQAGDSLSDDSFMLGQGDDPSIGVSAVAGMDSFSEDFNEDEASDAFDSLLSMSMSMSGDRYTVQRKKAVNEEAVSRKSTVYISSTVKDTVNKISSAPAYRVSKKRRDKTTVTSLVTIAQRTRNSIDKDVSLLRLISQKTSDKSTEAASRLLETMRRSLDGKEELLRQAVSVLKEKRFDRPDKMRQRFLQLCALDQEQIQLLDRRVSSDMFLRAYSPRKQPMDLLSVTGDLVREVNNTFVTQPPSPCDLVSSKGTLDDDGQLRSDLHLLHAYDYHLTKIIARNKSQTKAYCKSVLQSTKWFLNLVQHIRKYHDNRRPDLKASSNTPSSHSGLIPISLLKLVSIVKQLLLLGIEFTKEIVWFLIIKIINREDFKFNVVYVTIQFICDQVQLTSSELYDYLVALNVEIAPKLSDRVRKNRQINERIKIKNIVHQINNQLQQQGSSNRGNTTTIYFDSLFGDPSSMRHDYTASFADIAEEDQEEQANEVMATNRPPLYL